MTKLPEIPADYKKFLESHDGETEYLFGETDGWRFYSADELMEVIRVDREEVKNIFKLTAYAQSARKFYGDETEDQDGEPYSFDRLAKGLAIGDNNGDVVFLDPNDAYSVWIWHHDGGDVERLADSFNAWLESAEPVESDSAEDDEG